jgi:dephospho-CoA kinase
MTKIIGLTGGIGSGKTTISKFFEAEGIPVFISDLEAKKIIELPETIAEISKIFPGAIVKNSLNKKILSELVFKNPTELEKLNRIIHPLVKAQFDKWLKQNVNQKFVVKEAAILFESNGYKNCNKIITVVTPLETRIERVMLRDNSSRNQVLDRIKNQSSDEEKISKSDFVIHNENKNTAKKEFDEILKKLKNP